MPGGTSVRTCLILPDATEAAQDRAGNRWEDWVRGFRRCGFKRCTFVNNVGTLECKCHRGKMDTGGTVHWARGWRVVGGSRVTLTQVWMIISIVTF